MGKTINDTDINIVEWLRERGLNAIRRYDSAQIDLLRGDVCVATLEGSELSTYHTKSETLDYIKTKLNVV